MGRIKKRYKLLSLFLVIYFAGCGAPSRNYEDYSQFSGFNAGECDSLSSENLEVLGKVWGYVKYHHPAFADDKYNVDYELFGLLPEVVAADKERRNEILLNWVNSLGKFKENTDLKTTEQAEEYITLPDFGWLRDTLTLGSGLSDKLVRMRYAERKAGNRYISYTGAGNPTFSNEDEYDGATIDHGFMLLGLFRLWNIVEYYCPNRNITDNAWESVLPKYIKILLEGDVKNYRHYMAMLIAEINDTHSNFNVSFEFGQRMIPLKMRFVDGELIVASDPFGRNDGFGISVGDRVLSIGGSTPDNIKKKVRLYRSLSNEASLDREAALLASHVHRSQAVPRKGVPVRIEQRKTGDVLEVAMPSISVSEYYKAVRETDKSMSKNKESRLIADSIGYFNPYDIQDPNSYGYDEAKADAIMNLFEDTKAIIVDMRGYPPSLAYKFIPKYLMAQNTQMVIFTIPTYSLPGTYRERDVSIGRDNQDIYKGRIVVLVNEQTQSAAEYTTMAFQALPNCTIVGSQTAGADGNVSQIVLPGKMKFYISGLGVYYPDMTNAQRAGVKIDHYVTPTIEGAISGRDEVLEKAIELINAN